MKKTKEELQEYKEKYLVILQDTFLSFQIGLIGLEDFVGMVMILTGMIHGIFHDEGKRTFNCGSDDHTHTFEKIDELYSASEEDAESGNDVISWVEDPEKRAKLKKMIADRTELEATKMPPKGHLQ